MAGVFAGRLATHGESDDEPAQPPAYYVARAEVSRTLARKAADPMIAAIHQDLAARYDAIVSRLDDNGDAVGGAQPA